MRLLLLLCLIISMITQISGCSGSSDKSSTASNSTGLLKVDSTTSVAAKGVGSLSVDFTSSTLKQAGTIVTVTVDNPVIVFDTTTATLDNSGKATFTFRALDTQTDAVAHVTVTGGSIVVNRTITVKGTGGLTPGVDTTGVNSISFSAADPKNISLKGMGAAGKSETSIVTFLVKDQLGNPLANQKVVFSLDTSVGGISLSIPYAISDAKGVVQTVVSAGSIATTVKVTATVQGKAISVKSDSLVISTGIPHQDGMSVSLNTYYSESLDYDNIVIPVQVMLADHFGNPVPDNTAVYFSVYGGSIEPSGFTTNGIAQVNWRSQNPRPADGKARLLIYALGEESFTDANGSGLADEGEFTDITEAFQDLNGNGIRDDNEPFIDYNVNAKFDDDREKLFNGVLQGIEYKSKNIPTSKHIFVNKVITMSGSTATITGPYPAIIKLASSETASELTDIKVVIKDKNGNPMPDETTVNVDTLSSVCISAVAGSDTFTISRGKTEFTITMKNSCTLPGNSSFTISTATPKEQKTRKTFTLSY